MSFIIIRSKDRHTSSASSASCKFLLTPGIALPESKTPKRLRLEYAQVFNMPYHIQTGVNDTVDFWENAVVKTSTLTAGWYTALDLATELATRLTATSAGYNTYTVTYATRTGKLTFAAANAFDLRLLTGTNTAKSPWRELGFLSTNGLAAVDSGSGTSATAPFPVNLGLPLSWYVNIVELGTPIQTSAGGRSSLYLPMTVSSGSLMEYNKLLPAQKLSTEQVWLSKLTVSWTSPDSLLSLQNTEWELCFRVLE